MAAAAIDAIVIVSINVVVVVVGHITKLFSVNPTSVFLFLVAGMVAVECFRRQTPGKLVTGLVIRPLSDGAIGHYEITLRVVVIAMSITAAVCCSELLLVYRVSQETFIAAAVFVGTLVTVVWPISVLVGRGDVGLHDLIAGTCVTTPHAQVRQPPRWFVVISLTLSALVAVFMAASIRGVLDAGRRLPDSNPDYTRIQLTLGEAVRSIEGYEELVSLYGCTIRPWTDAELDRFKFDKNVEGLGAMLVFNDKSFRRLVVCRIETTFDGLLNGDFQRSLAHRMSSEVSPEAPLDINYATHQSFGPIQIVLERRLVALGVTSRDNKPFALFVEPDQKFTFGVGVDILGLLP